MRRLAVAGIVLAFCTLTAAAQETTGSADTAGASGNWFTRLFSAGDKADPKKAPEKKKAEPVAPVETAASIRTREDIILNRRSKAILKLREVAILTNDAALLRKVDELETRANELYFQHVSCLPGRAEAELATAKTAGDAKQTAKTTATDDSTRGNK